jgi:hypothetical protein
MAEATMKYQTTKLYEETLHKLKLIAALTHESMVKVVERLAEQELKKLQEEKK